MSAHVIAAALMAASGVFAQPPPAAPADPTRDVVVTSPLTVEGYIRKKGWLVLADGGDLGRLKSEQVVCRRLSHLGSRIPSSKYTCDTVSQWQAMTFATRDYIRCLQIASGGC